MKIRLRLEHFHHWNDGCTEATILLTVGRSVELKVAHERIVWPRREPVGHPRCMTLDEVDILAATWAARRLARLLQVSPPAARDIIEIPGDDWRGLIPLLSEEHWWAIRDAATDRVGYICSDFDEGEVNAGLCAKLGHYLAQLVREVAGAPVLLAPGIVLVECRECGDVTLATERERYCGVCAGDNGRDVPVRVVCKHSDPLGVVVATLVNEAVK